MPAPTSSPPAIPKSSGYWLLGDIPAIRKDIVGWMGNKFEELGNTYEAAVLRHRLFVTNDPDFVKHILQDNNKNYHKSFGYDILKLFLGQGLLTSEGDFWLRQRRLAQPAFHKKRLASLASSMAEEASGWAERWKKLRESGASIDVMDEMMTVTMRIVARGLFSANVNDQIPVISENIGLLNDFAMARIQNPFPLPIWAPTPRQLAFKKAAQKLDSVIYPIIEGRRGHTQEFDDLLSMLIEVQDQDTGDQMTDAQLRDECMTIFVAGHETSAVTMTWIWRLLSLHPDVQDKLQAELKQVLNGRAPTLDDLPKLVYTRYVIDEGLRLYPPGWVIGRRALKEDLSGPFPVPADANILLVGYHTQRRADLWDAPNAFKPERWADPEVKKHRFAYFPFGGGPRFCIGNNFALMEMTFLLAALAQEVRVTPTNDKRVRMDPLITLRPKDAVLVNLS